jgi:hypothetical protein
LIKGGKFKEWGEGKYKALIDGDDTCVVKGQGFWVKTREEEEALRFYETDKYKVVRCGIWICGQERRVLTLRFRQEFGHELS